MASRKNTDTYGYTPTRKIDRSLKTVDSSRTSLWERSIPTGTVNNVEAQPVFLSVPAVFTRNAVDVNKSLGAAPQVTQG